MPDGSIRKTERSEIRGRKQSNKGGRGRGPINSLSNKESGGKKMIRGKIVKDSCAVGRHVGRRKKETPSKRRKSKSRGKDQRDPKTQRGGRERESM